MGGALTPGMMLAQYEVISLLGAGGMGEVYLAEDTRLGRKVALKVLPRTVTTAETEKRFIREARSVAALDHPNICTIYEVGQDNGQSYFAMQYVDGETLADWLDRGSNDLRAGLDIAVQVASALESAHQHGVIHRDVKPPNILITAGGQVKVVDFGLARLANAPELTGITRTGTVAGTYQYMSPEQLRGDKLDARTDIFSFGVMLYEIFGGHRPFDSDSPAATITSILFSEPPPFGTSDPILRELESLIRGALQKDLTRRLQTMGAVRAGMERLRQSAWRGSSSDDRTAEMPAVASAGTASPGGPASERQTGKRRPAPQPSAGGTGLVPGAMKSIAVLPFTNLSADPENEYFADGLTDEVTADLSRVRALRVISRTSSMTFKGTARDIKAIARELGVRYILEGSVRRSGNRLRITAQLIDASTDDHLWADKYDGTVEDVFAIQERLARMIVDALELRLTVDEDRRLAERPIGNVHAYECYLRARQEGWRWRKDSIDHAIQLLHNGLAIVGDNAGLYAALGLAYLQYRAAGIDSGEHPLHEAEICAGKVFALEPDSASGLLLRGWIDYSRGRIQEAVRDLKAALEIDSNNADTLLLLSNCYLISGKVSFARPFIDRLLSVDPLTPLSRCLPGWVNALDGNLAAAVEPYRQMFEMDPGNPMARLFYVWVLALNRRGDEVGAIVEAFPPEVRDTVPARLAFFLAHSLAGNSRDASAALTPEIEAAATTTDLFSRILAQGYALAGVPERALHWLAIAVDRGFINYPFLARYDPFFESLRSDPRFLQLMETVRERWERFEP